MSSAFDSDVRLRREHTPWARMDLNSFMKEAAQNFGGGDPRNFPAELSCHVRKEVSSGFWFTFRWTGSDGLKHTVSASTIDLCLWRAAEVELRNRNKDGKEAPDDAAG